MLTQILCKGQHRTNNIVEGWNNRFSSLTNCHHPNFWKFLRGLKKNNLMSMLRSSKQKLLLDTHEDVNKFGEKRVFSIC